MQEMMNRLMASKYLELLRLQKGGNRVVQIMAQAEPLLADHFLQIVMMGFYPLSYSILEAFRIISKLVPTEAICEKVRVFVEVEEGMRAVSDWYRNVPHGELYRRMFSSLATVPLEVDQQMFEQYRSALALQEGGLARALVAAAFIETTGLTVLQLLHDFVAQWQTLTGRSTDKVDLTYLNEHMLNEGTQSEDQHVNLINVLLEECGSVDLTSEIVHFEQVTEKWFNHVHDRVFGIMRSR